MLMRIRYGMGCNINEPSNRSRDFPTLRINIGTYISEVLRSYVIPVRRRMGRDFILMQDNARLQVEARDYLEVNNTELLPRNPANNSDLDPIEHVWDIMGRRLCN